MADGARVLGGGLPYATGGFGGEADARIAGVNAFASLFFDTRRIHAYGYSNILNTVTRFRESQSLELLSKNHMRFWRLYRGFHFNFTRRTHEGVT